MVKELRREKYSLLQISDQTTKATSNGYHADSWSGWAEVEERCNIFHKNREISILTMKKKIARLTLLQEATERTRQGEIQNKTRKTHSGMNESASLTPVQGPSTKYRKD
jgi:hypothetical protein